MADSFPTALQRTSDERWVTLSAVAQRDGRLVARVQEMNDVAAVVRSTADRDGFDRRLRALLAAPPPPAGSGVHLSWPTDLLHDLDGTVVGYVAPRHNAQISFPLEAFADPEQRAEIAPKATRRHLLRAARNAAAAVAAVHHAGHGGVRPQHLRLDDRARIVLVGVDSLEPGVGGPALDTDLRRLGGLIRTLLGTRAWATDGDLAGLLTSRDVHPAAEWFHALHRADRAMPDMRPEARHGVHAERRRAAIADGVQGGASHLHAAGPSGPETERVVRRQDLASALAEAERVGRATDDRDADGVPDQTVPDQTVPDQTVPDLALADQRTSDRDEQPDDGDELFIDRDLLIDTEPQGDAAEGDAAEDDAAEADASDDVAAEAAAPGDEHRSGAQNPTAAAGVAADDRLDREPERPVPAEDARWAPGGEARPAAGPETGVAAADEVRADDASPGAPATALDRLLGAEPSIDLTPPATRTSPRRRRSSTPRHAATGSPAPRSQGTPSRGAADPATAGRTPSPARAIPVPTADDAEHSNQNRFAFAAAMAIVLGLLASVAPFVAFALAAVGGIIGKAVGVGVRKSTRGPLQTTAIATTRLVPYATGGIALAAFILLDLLLLLGLCMAVARNLFEYGPGFTLTWILQLPEVPALVRGFFFAVASFAGFSIGTHVYDPLRRELGGRRRVALPALGLALCVGLLLVDANIVWWPLPAVAAIGG